MERKQFKCNYCNKGFIRESSLIKHECFIKNRWNNKNKKDVIIGFMSYQLFYKIQYGQEKDKSYEDFVKFKYYNDFCKFGKYCLDVNSIEINEYICYILTNQISLSKWYSDNTYFNFVKYFLHNEPIHKSIERSFKFILKWSKKSKNDYRLFFKLISTYDLVDYLRMGRISPWIVLLSKEGKTLLLTLTNEQLDLIDKTINMSEWDSYIKKYPNQVQQVKEIIYEMGV